MTKKSSFDRIIRAIETNLDPEPPAPTVRWNIVRIPVTRTEGLPDFVRIPVTDRPGAIDRAKLKANTKTQLAILLTSFCTWMSMDREFAKYQIKCGNLTLVEVDGEKYIPLSSVTSFVEAIILNLEKLSADLDKSGGQAASAEF